MRQHHEGVVHERAAGPPPERARGGQVKKLFEGLEPVSHVHAGSALTHRTPGTGDDALLWVAVAASMHERIAVLAADGTIVAVNESWRRGARAGGLPDDLVGASYLDACDAAGDDPYARQAAASLRGVLDGSLPAATLTYPLGDRWFMMRAGPITGAGEPRAVVVHADVTDEAAAEREAEERARLLDEVDVAVTAVDRDGRVTAWNSAAERVFGWTREEAVGRPGTDVLARDAAAGHWGAEPARAGDEQVVMRRRDGSSFHARHRCVHRPGPDGGRVCVTIDSTAEARASRRSSRPTASSRRSPTRWARASWSSIPRAGRC